MPTIDDLSDELAHSKSEDLSSSPTQPDPKLHEVDDDDDDEDIDETLAERLWGLTEMFPESVRSLSATATLVSIVSTKWLYNVGRITLWVAASSATILALPVMFESERSQMEEQQQAQQRQLLLGPNAAVSGGGLPGLVPQGR